jgi:hypothetical protein
MDPAAVEEEGETEGAAVEEEAPAAAPPRPNKKGVSKKSKAGLKKKGASKKSKAGPKKKRARRKPKKCPHNRAKYYCKDCGGKGICVHKRYRQTCRECGGSSVFPHEKQRHTCKECYCMVRTSAPTTNSAKPARSAVVRSSAPTTNSATNARSAMVRTSAPTTNSARTARTARTWCGELERKHAEQATACRNAWASEGKKKLSACRGERSVVGAPLAAHSLLLRCAASAVLSSALLTICLWTQAEKILVW